MNPMQRTDSVIPYCRATDQRISTIRFARPLNMPCFEFRIEIRTKPALAETGESKNRVTDNSTTRHFNNLRKGRWVQAVPFTAEFGKCDFTHSGLSLMNARQIALPPSKAAQSVPLHGRRTLSSVRVAVFPPRFFPAV